MKSLEGYILARKDLELKRSKLSTSLSWEATFITLLLFFGVNYLQHITLTMSSHSRHSNESERESVKYLLKKIAQDVQAFSYRQLQHETLLKEMDAQFALIQDEWKMVKERDENTKSKKSSHASNSRGNEYFKEQSLKINEYYQPSPRTTRKERKESPREVRVDLPYFHGKQNVEFYLDLEMKVEQLFACHKVSEERKVPLATLSFQGNAMYWWTTLERDMHLHKDPPIEYWNDLRGALRRRHIPSYYNRELMDKLQRLQQKTMSVEEYRQKMELYMMRASIRESKPTTLARFLSGLNLEIKDRVELLSYQDLNDLIQLCIKVEQKNLRKTSSRREDSYSMMEECFHSWMIVGGICESLMEVHSQGSPRRCGCLGGAV